MTTLEKILQEIEQECFKCREDCSKEKDVIQIALKKTQYNVLKHVEEIIKKHLSDNDDKKCSECSRRKFYQQGYEDGKKGDDGWIPVEERLPTREELLKDDGRFILDDGNRRYQGLFDIYDGKFKFSRHISGINYELFEDKCVIAWRPLPEPYRKDGEL